MSSLASDRRSSGLTGFAQLLLVLTSIAPIGLVYAAVLLDKGHGSGAFWATICVVVLTLGCRLLMTGVQTKCAPVPMEAAQRAPKEGDSLSFFVAYAMPIIAVDEPATFPTFALLAFSLLAALVVWRQRMFYVNPLLAIMGYRFYSAVSDSGRPVLIVTTGSGSLRDGALRVIRLSECLWLEVVS